MARNSAEYIRPLVKINTEETLPAIWKIEKAIKAQFDLDSTYCARVLVNRTRIYIHHHSKLADNLVEITFHNIDRQFKSYTSKIQQLEPREIARHIWNVCHDGSLKTPAKYPYRKHHTEMAQW